MTEQNLPFENSLARLEEILEKMNSGAVALEEALKLYEEADALIASCTKRLNEAEKKVEILIKNRAGEVEMSNGAHNLSHKEPNAGRDSLPKGSKEINFG